MEGSGSVPLFGRSPVPPGVAVPSWAVSSHAASGRWPGSIWVGLLASHSNWHRLGWLAAAWWVGGGCCCGGDGVQSRWRSFGVLFPLAEGARRYRRMTVKYKEHTCSGVYPPTQGVVTLPVLLQTLIHVEPLCRHERNVIASLWKPNVELRQLHIRGLFPVSCIPCCIPLSKSPPALVDKAVLVGCFGC